MRARSRAHAGGWHAKSNANGAQPNAARTDHRYGPAIRHVGRARRRCRSQSLQPYAGGLIDCLAIGTKHLAAEVEAGDLEGAKQAWIAARVGGERRENPTKRWTAGRMPTDERASLFPLLTGSACRALGAAEGP